MAILSSFFVDGMTRQFDTVILEASIYGILAVGLGVVLVTGNIDLSIGFQGGHLFHRHCLCIQHDEWKFSICLCCDPCGGARWAYLTHLLL